MLQSIIVECSVEAVDKKVKVLVTSPRKGILECVVFGIHTEKRCTTVSILTSSVLGFI